MTDEAVDPPPLPERLEGPPTREPGGLPPPGPDDPRVPGPDDPRVPGPDGPPAEEPDGPPQRPYGTEHSPTRRRVLRGAGLVGMGAALGVVGFAEAARVAERKLPLLPGPAAATVADRSAEPGSGQVRITWVGGATDKLIALTFDDGPRPEWTTMTLDTLDRLDVPATFFVVGRRVRKYAHVVQGRMDRHEIGNHTWNHHDLARRSQDDAYEDLARAHEAIVEVIGQTPRLCRPPYGHVGGAAVLAADRLGYELVLWSLQMVESEFPNDPRGHAQHVVSAVVPGTILLAHDIDAYGRDRRVALDGLPDMIGALREQGYEFVTVSELMRRTAGSGARP